MDAPRKPTLAVWKFASCDGCQLSLLDLEDELLALADRVEIAYFLEASSATVEGPYDVSLVEGSITTAHDAERIREVRASSRALVTIGACATAGGIQALRNFADVDEFTRIVYASPDYISTLATSTPISAHVPVDFELQRLPDQQAPAARGDQRPPEPPAAARARAQRVRRVQAPRHRVRDGRPRHRLPRPGHPRRLRRDLPGLRPRLLRLLRAEGDPEHRVAGRAGPGSEDDATWSASTAPSTPRAEPFRAGERGAMSDG